MDRRKPTDKRITWTTEGGAPSSPIGRSVARSTEAPNPADTPRRYVGVAWEEAASKWAAKIWVNELQRVERIAHFDDPHSAAVAHDRVALEIAGPRGRRLNFPRKQLKPATIADIRRERRDQHVAARRARVGTGYLGVYRHAAAGGPRWAAQISIGGKLVQVGKWSTARAAALAYDRAALEHKGHAVNLPRVAARLGPATVKELRAEAARAFKATTTSKFRGVHWNRDSRKWRASIRVDGVLTDLGLFTDEEEAAHAYDRATCKARGRAAPVNFP